MDTFISFTDISTSFLKMYKCVRICSAQHLILGTAHRMFKKSCYLNKCTEMHESDFIMWILYISIIWKPTVFAFLLSLVIDNYWRTFSRKKSAFSLTDSPRTTDRQTPSSATYSKRPCQSRVYCHPFISLKRHLTFGPNSSTFKSSNVGSCNGRKTFWWKNITMLFPTEVLVRLTRCEREKRWPRQCRIAVVFFLRFSMSIIPNRREIGSWLVIALEALMTDWPG